jgi:regulator of replication initiation timing
MKAASRTVEVEPIDRLEEKIKQLVALVERLRSEQARAIDEQQRLARELEALRARAGDSERLAAELAALRAERDAIRARVADMLEQIEALQL